MSVALMGIRLHDNVQQTWFNIYPEKQLARCTEGKGTITIVFGGQNVNTQNMNVRGQLVRGDGTALIDYAAPTKLGETHVFELTFDMRNFMETFTVKVSNADQVGITALPPIPYPDSYQFVVASIPTGLIPVPVSPTPQPNQPPSGTMPSLPPLIPFLEDVTNWFQKTALPDFKLFNMSGIDFGNMLGTVGNALGKTIAEPLKGLPDLLTVLNSLPTSVTNVLGSIVGDLISGLFESGSDLMSQRILSTLKGTPESVKSVLAQVPFGFGNSFEKYVKVTNPEYYLSQIEIGGDAMPAVRQQVADAVNLLREMDALNLGLSLASLGQVRVVADEIGMLEGMFGAGALIHSFNGIRQEKAINKRVEYYFNEVFQPEIPNTQDLINMVVKEKMSISDFKQYMLKRGFATNWSQLLWDAHFKAPDLNDILTAWRRGLIDEKRVDELMIIVDLDPAFKQIFDTRKYNDPSLSITRLMFETGAIDATKVPDYVHRLGFAPEFEAAITEFILHFQERRYKTRYITQLMTALAQNQATEDEVKTAVKDIGFTDATAALIIKTSLLRRRTYKTATTATLEKALTLGELKKAYIEDIINEDELRNTMLTRGYTLIDVNIVVNLLNKDKIVETEGKRIVVLTVAEMVNAWRYNVITEDMLRTTLLTRGLDLNEIDILINTKKAMWGVTGASA
jgi:hypothetical protein